MGRHRIPSLLGPTALTGLIMVVTLALLWWVFPEEGAHSSFHP